MERRQQNDLHHCLPTPFLFLINQLFALFMYPPIKQKIKNSADRQNEGGRARRGWRMGRKRRIGLRRGDEERESKKR